MPTLSNRISFPTNSTPGNVPIAGNMYAGEMFINDSDKIAYIKSQAGDLFRLSSQDLRYITSSGVTIPGNANVFISASGNITSYVSTLGAHLNTIEAFVLVPTGNSVEFIDVLGLEFYYEGTVQSTVIIQEGLHRLKFVYDAINSLWMVFASTINLATETTAGKLRFATQAEVDAGGVTDAAITPSTLANYSPGNHPLTVDVTLISSPTYTISATDQCVVYTGAGNAVFNMPAFLLGRSIYIRNRSSNGGTLTLNTVGGASGLINGLSSITVDVYSSFELICESPAWGIH